MFMLLAPARRSAARRCFSTSSLCADKVAFIGLGNMGASMASNLLKSGHEVRVFDVSPVAMDKLKSQGGLPASSPSEAADGAQAVVTMLPSSPHVRDVICGKGGVLKALSPGSIIIDSSTIDPNVTREVNLQCEKAGVLMVDAPVSGGVKGAAEGTLTFMVGGSEEAFQRAKPYLSSMGKKIVHCGGAGTGEVAKLCNNLALGIQMIGISEAMNLGNKLGIDPHVLASIMSSSTAGCWSCNVNNPHPGVIETAPATNGYKGGFGTELMMKDLGLAIQAGNTVDAHLPLGSNAFQLFGLSADHGGRGRDFSSVYEFLSKSSRRT